MSARPSLAVRVGFDLPDRPPGDELRELTLLALRKRKRGVVGAGAGRVEPAWSAPHFGLDHSWLFRSASPEAQRAILARCSRGLLGEALNVERAGVAFAAKMVLLAESTDERVLYATFAGDEASHLSSLRPFCEGHTASAAGDPFADLLRDVIEGGTRASLQLIIQVVLEGWGLMHYRVLSNGCTDPDLAAALDAILRDETAHHGSGILLLRGARFSAEEARFSLDALSRLLGMVRAGPASVIAAVEAELGPLADAERRELLHEVDAETHIRTRLERLRALLGKVESARDIVAALERRGDFTPPSPEELS